MWIKEEGRRSLAKGSRNRVRLARPVERRKGVTRRRPRRGWGKRLVRQVMVLGCWLYGC